MQAYPQALILISTYAISCLSKQVLGVSLLDSIWVKAHVLLNGVSSRYGLGGSDYLVSMFFLMLRSYSFVICSMSK